MFRPAVAGGKFGKQVGNFSYWEQIVGLFLNSSSHSKVDAYDGDLLNWKDTPITVSA